MYGLSLSWAELTERDRMTDSRTISGDVLTNSDWADPVRHRVADLTPAQR
jgi:hypothetical protein